MKIIAPSILAADFSRLGDEIRAVENAGADWIHCDVMDGHFVPPITVGPLVIEAASRVTKLPLDVHLMIENPDAAIPQFAKAGASYITVHQETCPHLNRTIQLIRNNGAKAGVAINPSTPVSTLEEILDDVDMVLVMTVNPGFGGQEFIESGLLKVARLRQVIDEMNTKPLIQVDGGVKGHNIGRLAEAGVDVFVAGSAIFESKDYTQTITAFRKQITNGR
jgi:ribulose-phosphate 3-epimerase